MDKKCNKCEEIKSIDEYYKDRSKKDGCATFCKVCSRLGKKTYYEANKEKIKTKSKNYYETNKKDIAPKLKAYREANKERIAKYKKRYREINKEKLKAQRKARYEANKEEYAARSRVYYQNNKEETIKRTRDYYHNNKEKVFATGKRYYEANKEKINIYKSEWVKKRCREDPAFRLRMRVSQAVRLALKSATAGKGVKNGSTFDYLPYTSQQLKEHIESQFQEGMSWDNWGNGEDCWHLDHIYPQSKLIYDTLDHPNFKKCWALENLQPLWAIDNLKKGDTTC